MFTDGWFLLFKLSVSRPNIDVPSTFFSSVVSNLVISIVQTKSTLQMLSFPGLKMRVMPFATKEAMEQRTTTSTRSFEKTKSALMIWLGCSNRKLEHFCTPALVVTVRSMSITWKHVWRKRGPRYHHGKSTPTSWKHRRSVSSQRSRLTLTLKKRLLWTFCWKTWSSSCLRAIRTM